MISMASAPTIFHFNCPLCGAHPGPMLLTAFVDRWQRSSQGDFDGLCAAYMSVVGLLLQRSTSRKRRKVLDQIRGLLQVILGTPETAALEGNVGGRRVWLETCPFCNSPDGERQRNSYFTYWEQADRVQVANLFYEMTLVLYAFVRATPRWVSKSLFVHVGSLIDASSDAASDRELYSCPFCARRTNCLYGDGTSDNPVRCRWCLDRQGIGVEISESDDGVRMQFGDDICEISTEGEVTDSKVSALTPLTDDLVPRALRRTPPP
jgi:hypothetical protein